jgi:hypothetical protein
MHDIPQLWSLCVSAILMSRAEDLPMLLDSTYQHCRTTELQEKPQELPYPQAESDVKMT